MKKYILLFLLFFPSLLFGYTYTLTTSGMTIVRSDGAVIPVASNNVDYQAYLAWVAAGNTPSPAPSPTTAQTALAAYNTALSAGYTPSGQSYTFALDPLTIQLFGVIAQRIALGDTSTMTVYDTTGTGHSFVLSATGTKTAVLAYLTYYSNLIQTAQAAGAIN